MSLLFVERVLVCGLQGMGGHPETTPQTEHPTPSQGWRGPRCRAAGDLGLSEVHVWTKLGREARGQGVRGLSRSKDGLPTGS